MKTLPDESFFLSASSVPMNRDMSRCMVLGVSDAGLELTKRLTAAGVEVVLVGADGKDEARGVESASSALELVDIRGFKGGFEAVVRTDEGVRTERVGSVVAAGAARMDPKFEKFGLSRSDRILSLSDLEETLKLGRPLPGPAAGEWTHVAFFFGLDEESGPAEFSRILAALEKLADLDKVQAYVFCRQVKVAGSGLERRYGLSRESGALYFKFDDEGPELSQDEQGTRLVFRDPMLGSEVELAPDLLVVDESLLPPADLARVLEIMPSAPAFEPYLSPESIRFPGVETPKAGVLALGPARGVYLEEWIRSDIDAVVSLLTGANGGEPPRAASAVAEVTPSRCTICLTCLRLCPHGAIGFGAKAEIDPASCMGCGVCVAECPMKAIELKPLNGDAKPEASPQAGNIVAFVCSRSAADAITSLDPKSLEGVTVVKVPCAGAVSVSQILEAFVGGAAGVVVAGCFQGNCASIYGSTMAKLRTAEATRILEDAGASPGRIVFAPCASNTPAVLADAIRELQEIAG